MFEAATPVRRRASVHSQSTQLALVLSVDEFASALRVNRRTIIRMIDRELIRAVRVGRVLRIPRSELDRLLSTNAV
jgi:excisionase family DNA binding protein